MTYVVDADMQAGISEVPAHESVGLLYDTAHAIEWCIGHG